MILNKTKTNFLIGFKKDQVNQEVKLLRLDHIKNIPFGQAGP